MLLCLDNWRIEFFRGEEKLNCRLLSYRGTSPSSTEAACGEGVKINKTKRRERSIKWVLGLYSGHLWVTCCHWGFLFSLFYGTVEQIVKINTNPTGVDWAKQPLTRQVFGKEKRRRRMDNNKTFSKARAASEHLLYSKMRNFIISQFSLKIARHQILSLATMLKVDTETGCKKTIFLLVSSSLPVHLDLSPHPSFNQTQKDNLQFLGAHSSPLCCCYPESRACVCGETKEAMS